MSDCSLFIQKFGQQDKAVAAADYAAGEDLFEDVVGNLVGFALVGVEAIGEAQERLAGGRAGSDDRAEARELL